MITVHGHCHDEYLLILHNPRMHMPQISIEYYMKVKNKMNVKTKRSLLLSGLVLMAAAFAITAHASTTSEKISDLNEKKAQTENQLKTTESRLSELESSKGSLESYMSNLNTQLSELNASLSVLEEQSQAKSAEIAVTRTELEAAEADEQSQYDAMKKRIKFLYEKEDSEYLELLISSESITDLLNKVSFVSQLADYDRKMLVKLQDTKNLIVEKAAALEAEQNELNTLQAQIIDQEKSVTALVTSTSNEITLFKSQIESSQEELAAYEAKLLEQEKELEKLQFTAAAEQAASAGGFSYVVAPSEKAMASSNLDLMAAIIECEAGGESYEGKIAVGNVVMNRLNSSRYPDTLIGVLYQKYQFAPVTSGRFEIVLNRGANAACYQAAQNVFNGEVVIPYYLHFRTVIPGITGIIIGGHIFYE